MTFAKTLPMTLRREMPLKLLHSLPSHLVLEERDDFGVPHVLWYSSSLQVLTEEYMQGMQ